jgi:hypothetical protein
MQKRQKTRIDVKTEENIQLIQGINLQISDIRKLLKKIYGKTDK